MEILHKAKSLITKEWIEGYIVIYPSGVAEIIEKKEQKPDVMQVIPVDPETVCVYIGKTDKEGKKIFTGDIFMFPDEVWESTDTSCGTEWDSWEATNYGVVGYCDYSARFDFVKYKYNQNSIEADLHENNDLDFGEFVSGLIAAGNVFDNPELLERTV